VKRCQWRFVMLFCKAVYRPAFAGLLKIALKHSVLQAGHGLFTSALLEELLEALDGLKFPELASLCHFSSFALTVSLLSTAVRYKPSSSSRGPVKLVIYHESAVANDSRGWVRTGFAVCHPQFMRRKLSGKQMTEIDFFLKS
jgi:hypothetical protein